MQRFGAVSGVILGLSIGLPGLIEAPRSSPGITV
jgi:hypothetical protein